MEHSNPATRSRPVPEQVRESGVWVFESRHDASFEMRASRHRFPELLYFREGRGHIQLDLPARSERILCVPGECVIVPANAEHVIEDLPGKPITLYGLAIDPERVPVCRELGDLLPYGSVPRQRIALLDIEQRMRRILYLANTANPVAKFSAIASTIDLFASLAQPAPVSQPSAPEFEKAKANEIDEYIHWLNHNFYEPVSLDDAARACAMSRRKFTNLFRERTGTTWLRYLHHQRVQHAVTLLRETDAQVTSIAFQCGFEDLSTFYRVFKNTTGKQPLELRSPNGGSAR